MDHYLEARSREQRLSALALQESLLWVTPEQRVLNPDMAVYMSTSCTFKT